MKTRTITMREKIIASAASAALAASMVVCVPSMAFATYDTGSITANSNSISVVQGSQTDMSKLFTYTAQGGDGAWHVDYKITDGTAATVNKHSGKLTANATGDVVVTAYLTGIAQPTQNKNNPCNSDEAKYSSSIKVSVKETSDYGFQGVNGLSIKMTNHEIGYVGGDNDSGWANSVEGLTAADDGYYYFNIEMNNGFKKYNTTASFAARNAGQISLSTTNTKTNETKTYELASDNKGVLSISSVDEAAKTIVVKVDPSALSNVTSLDFLSNLRGNNDTKTLGTTVSFVF